MDLLFAQAAADDLHWQAMLAVSTDSNLGHAGETGQKRCRIPGMEAFMSERDRSRQLAARLKTGLLVPESRVAPVRMGFPLAHLALRLTAR